MNEETFWSILDKMAWEYEGDDEMVVEPVVEYLSKLEDDEIFAFEDIMAQLLYNIDSKVIAKQMYATSSFFSADGFLYARCVALINGKEYYYNILNGKQQLDEDLEFESILYVPMDAWAKKYDKDVSDYPHLAEPSYESCSNEQLWGD